MNLFLMRFWRLAWARHAVPAIGGWRHLFWRLWWRLPVEPPEQQHPVELLPLAAPAVLHLVVEPEHRPLCGVSIREPWTIEIDATTCPECRKEGEAMMVQWLTNNR